MSLFALKKKLWLNNIGEDLSDYTVVFPFEKIK